MNNWVDSFGNSLKIGDFVYIDKILHVIKERKIKDKNKIIFDPIPEKDRLLEYHYLFYKQARKCKITKIQ